MNGTMPKPGTRTTQPEVCRGAPSLFVSYDGLTDPLGGSQIIPYVRSIAAHPRQVHVLSFEKADRYASAGPALAAQLSSEGIGWTPLPFSRGALGKLWDLLRMHWVALRLVLRHGIQIVHCRGHVCAQVGLFLKLLTRTQLLFDVRGLWVDERVDKGGWNLSKRLDRSMFSMFKWVERHLFRRADQLVVLTKALKQSLVGSGMPSDRITVVPCCADYDHFVLPAPGMVTRVRQELELPTDGIVLGYLGSVSPMYMTGQFLDFAEKAFEAKAIAAILCLTPDVEAMEGLIERRLWRRREIPYCVRAASRSEVPRLLSAMDLMASFFLPTPARLGTSPTKMAECFAQGIPMITNPGVGDVSALIDQLEAGMVVDPASVEAMNLAVTAIPLLVAKGGARLRDAARPFLGLDHAAAKYLSVYCRLEHPSC